MPPLCPNDEIQQRKFELQDSQYEFPYHHIPFLDITGIAIRHRVLSWGCEYLCYMRHALEIAGDLQPQSVLEVGCGDGRFLGMLVSAFRRVGVDLSGKAISFARAFYPDVDFEVGDANAIDEQFDLVAAIEVLEHIPNTHVTEFLNSLSHRARAGGHVLISVPTKVRPVTEKHYRHYDLPLFQHQLATSKAGLRIKDVQYIYRNHWIPRMYSRLTCNRYWFVDISVLQCLMWRLIWKRFRYASHQNGTRLFVLLERQ